jgi:hypothetical protein
MLVVEKRCAWFSDANLTLLFRGTACCCCEKTRRSCKRDAKEQIGPYESYRGKLGRCKSRAKQDLCESPFKPGHRGLFALRKNKRFLPKWTRKSESKTTL